MPTSPEGAPQVVDAGWRPGQMTTGTAGARMIELANRPSLGATQEGVENALAQHRIDAQNRDERLRNLGLHSRGPSSG